MSIDGKLRQLLDMHGHSYSDAERITGVCRETVRRLANGHRPPKTPKYLKEIAQGYGIDYLALMEGATVRDTLKSDQNGPP